MIPKDLLGMFKIKGGVYTLHPARFNQMEELKILPYKLLGMNVIGYAINTDGSYWIICWEPGDRYVRVEFAGSKEWFVALTTIDIFKNIPELPQIYITGVG